MACIQQYSELFDTQVKGIQSTNLAKLLLVLFSGDWVLSVYIYSWFYGHSGPFLLDVGHLNGMLEYCELN